MSPAVSRQVMPPPQPRTTDQEGGGILSRIGVRSGEELRKVLLFMVAAFLGNAFFVIGRNVGTVLFLAHLGPEHLTQAIFISGMSSILVGQLFSSASKGRSALDVNSWLLGAGAVILLGLYLAAINVPDSGVEDASQKMVVFVIFFAIYMAEDVFTMFVAMQCASVAQTAFSVADAKRLFGFVQLGNSFAAMTVGICIGSIAALVGTVQLLAIQSFLLFVSLLLNVHIGKLYLNTERSGLSKKKNKDKQIADSGLGADQPWWKNFLVLAMGLWGFTVIFTKTMFEYEYNVLIAGKLDAQEMVALTGYLYAGAGLASTAINLLGTKMCLEKLGMQGAIFATPAALLSVSLAIMVNPSITTTFAGRLVDLSLRWSLNNTVRTVLWIAVPQQQAAAAKPWVEGTIKKMGQAFNAVVITVALYVSKGNLNALSFLSLGFCTILSVCCLRVYSLYLQSMWGRIKRRELQADQVESLPHDAIIDSQIWEKLMNGGSATQIAVLSQMGTGLSAQYWEEFFARFYSLSAAVQVKVLELGRKQPARISDEFLLEILGDEYIEPSVLQLAVLAAGDRKIFSALDCLRGLLGQNRPSLRAAAAVSIINMGWGVGLGNVSSAALMVLETMLDEALEGSLRLDGNAGALRAAHVILRSRGVPIHPHEELTAEQLEEQVELLRQEWESAIEAADVGQATVLAIQVTHVKSALADLRRRSHEALKDSRTSTPQLSTAQDPATVMSPRNSLSAHQAWPLDTVTPATLQAWPLDRAATLAAAPLDRQGSHAKPDRCEEITQALLMLQQLPNPRTLLSFESWMRFLVHESPKVRVAALALVRKEDANPTRLRQQSILKPLVKNLQTVDTYMAAESALWKLGCPARIQEEVVDEFKVLFDRHKALADQRLSENAPDRGLQYMGFSSGMMYLLKFLRRQCTRVSQAELDTLRLSSTCDKLLEFSSAINDADVLQELMGTMADLKDQGFNITKQLAVSRIYHVAEKMCQGLSVQRWIEHRCQTFNRDQLQELRRNFAMPSRRDGTWFGAPSEMDKGIQQFGDRELVATVLKIGLGYVGEHIYLQRLQLLHLSVLVAPVLPASYRSTRVLAAWRLLRSHDDASEAAVIEVLDSMLPVALKGVVLPLLDSSPLDKKLSVINSLPGGDTSHVIWKDSSFPPPWADEWLQGSLSLLGAQFAAMLSRTARFRRGHTLPPPIENSLLPKVFLLSNVNMYAGLLSIHLAELACIARARSCTKGKFECKMGETYIIASGTFCYSQTAAQQSGPALRTGDVLQELHSICKELPVRDVECTSEEGGSVLCISWADLFALMVRLTPKFSLGILRNLVRTLPAPRSSGGMRMSRVSAQMLGLRQRLGTEQSIEISINVDEDPPKLPQDGDKEEQPGFAGRGKSKSEDIAELARLHEDAAEEGGERRETDMSQGGIRQKEQEGDDTESEATKGVGEGEEGLLTAKRSSDPSLMRESFSLLEKLLLLQEVKLFRYVPLEYLPDIAKCCAAIFRERGSAICAAGQQTDATLYIVADGLVGLYKRVGGGDLESGQTPAVRPASSDTEESTQYGRLLRKLQDSDTMGNMALLHDDIWQYSAVAMEDTWLLCVDRTHLTDVLRGRRDLASAVIHGLYKTFTRRIKKVVLKSNLNVGTPHEGRN